MNKIAQRRENLAMAARQAERYRVIQNSEAMALVGRMPTFMEYVTYHCYTWIMGREPMSDDLWVASLGGNNGMDGGVP